MSVAASRFNRWQLVALSAAVTAVLFCGSPSVLAQAKKDNKAAAPAKKESASNVGIPGGVLRWSSPGTRSCSMGKKAWKPLGETCYYPIDLLQKPGMITVTRAGSSGSQSARVTIEAFDYGTQEVDLPDIPQRDPSASDRQRMTREGTVLAKVWQRKETPAQFTLPLGPPAKPMASGKAFGVNRVFNGKPAPQPHMGTDYLTPAGTPVIAVADGTVALAMDLFHPGNAVFVDHGDGLITESFHLAEISVKNGDIVKKGDLLGKVGTTGRSTGPHLFFGMRWHGARIDPKWLLGDPAKIPAVTK